MRAVNVKPKRILLVEDEPQVRSATKLLLAALFESDVTEAADGQEALAKYAPDRFDLVVTDFQMPNLDGFGLTVELRKINPAQAIVMITAYPDRAEACAVDAIVPKPFVLPQLIEAVEKALKNRPAVSTEDN